MELEIWIIHRKIIWKHLFYAQILRWQINFRSCFSWCSLWSWPPSSPYYSSPSLSLVSSSSSSWFSSLSTGIPSSPSALFLILTEAIIARAGLSDGVYYITDGRKYDAGTSSQHLTYSHHTLLPALDQQQSSDTTL